MSQNSSPTTRKPHNTGGSERGSRSGSENGKSVDSKRENNNDNSKDIDESDDLLSDYTSETTFFDEERSPSMIATANNNEIWSFSFYKTDGKVIHLLFFPSPPLSSFFFSLTFISLLSAVRLLLIQRFIFSESGLQKSKPAVTLL